MLHGAVVERMLGRLADSAGLGAATAIVTGLMAVAASSDHFLLGCMSELSGSEEAPCRRRGSNDLLLARVPERAELARQ